MVLFHIQVKSHFITGTYLQVSMRNHHLRMQKNQFVSMGDISVDQLMSLETRRKQSSVFLTQKTIELEEQIIQNNFELNMYLDHLGEKVKGVIQHNEAEVLIAYKNHYAKVKKQLEDFKRQTEAQENSSSSYKEKIELLEKELAIFREESLKLFTRVTDKDKIIQQLKFDIDELMSQKRHMDGLVKQLTKKNKELELERSRMETKRTEGQTVNLEINSFSKNFELKNGLRENRYYESKRPFSNLSKRSENISKQSKTITFDPEPFHQFAESDLVIRRLKEKLTYLSQSALKDISEVLQEFIGGFQRQKRIQYRSGDQSLRSRSNYTVDLAESLRNATVNPATIRRKDSIQKKSQDLNKDMQLCEYFKKCIQTVRKEVTVRKKTSSINFFKSGTPITIQEFKKLDFFRLMQLICSHDLVIQNLYESLIEVGK